MVAGSDLSVDKDKCIGCGICMASYDQLFKFDKQGKSIVIESGECEDCDIKDVIEICPHGAIAERS
ncbi:MAG: ferredoxin [Candidatus Berkelbacteria bacterium]|nr:ferredoxin [Candidatus Berkelbacteria bacterium]